MVAQKKGLAPLLAHTNMKGKLIIYMNVSGVGQLKLRGKGAAFLVKSFAGVAE